MNHNPAESSLCFPTTGEYENPLFKFQLSYLTNYEARLNSLSFSFLICEMRMIAPTISVFS